MNNNKAEEYGRFVLSAGMPWEAGMFCGPFPARCTDGNGFAADYPNLWPDLRDPVTAGFFISWALAQTSKAGCTVNEFIGGKVSRLIFEVGGAIYEFDSDTRVGVWIEALRYMQSQTRLDWTKE